MNNKIMRSEAEIFADLAKLCNSKGYLHAIAYFCFRDNVISVNDEVRKEDILKQYGDNRLLRTEISTLIGLACLSTLDLTVPHHDEIEKYINKTESLLHELHESMNPAVEDMFKLDEKNQLVQDFNPFQQGVFLREPIFYGGESAYDFQYRDLSRVKYKSDEDWIINNKGYSLNELCEVINAVRNLQLDKMNQALPEMLKKHPKDWTYLDAHIFSVEEVLLKLKPSFEIANVRKIIESFVSNENYSFSALDDFNQKNAFPIIQIYEDQYILFQSYSLFEALYESPFFWFINDKNYRNQAMTNRGKFTEEFSAARLSLVFENSRVFPNVIITNAKGDILGEIDVLVMFADRAIVVQAKSKKLTITSRKGNDQSLQDDFKKAVQDAYDQAYSCSNLLLSDDSILIDEQGSQIDVSNILFKEIYPICIVSDHYPALFFQSRNFLKYKVTDVIKSPFVMDVFCLDVLTEMLKTPLYFLSYLQRRTDYAEKLLASHELTILAYHLKNNLWFDSNFSMIHFHDDFSAELDLAMLSRRDGLNGKDTFEGILTKYAGTNIDGMIKQVERRNDSRIIDFGLQLLKLSENTIFEINEAIEELCRRSNHDGKNHDLTMGFDNDGLTIHCNNDELSEASRTLKSHAELRKYYCKVPEWHGICIDPQTKKIRFGINLNHEWQFSEKMENKLSTMAKPSGQINLKTKVKPPKVGVNDDCPCGSGKKYKKCCRS